MKIFVMAPLACLALVAGCAAADRQAESVEAEQKLQRETDQRLRALEQLAQAAGQEGADPEEFLRALQSAAQEEA